MTRVSREFFCFGVTWNSVYKNQESLLLITRLIIVAQYVIISRARVLFQFLILSLEYLQLVFLFLFLLFVMLVDALLQTSFVKWRFNRVTFLLSFSLNSISYLSYVFQLAALIPSFPFLVFSFHVFHSSLNGRFGRFSLPSLCSSKILLVAKRMQIVAMIYRQMFVSLLVKCKYVVKRVKYIIMLDLSFIRDNWVFENYSTQIAKEISTSSNLQRIVRISARKKLKWLYY